MGIDSGHAANSPYSAWGNGFSRHQPCECAQEMAVCPRRSSTVEYQELTDNWTYPLFRPRAIGHSRSSQRYEPLEDEEEKRLIAEMLVLVGKHPRYGYRRICVLLRRDGWKVNRKRIYRLWVQEGLKVPQKQRKSGVWAVARTVAFGERPSTRTTYGHGTSSTIEPATVGR